MYTDPVTSRDDDTDTAVLAGTAGQPPAVADSMRSRILRGAIVAFGQRGYRGTSVELILAEAGVSRRTFYKTFRSKEDVLIALFQNSVDMLLSAVRQADQEHSEKRARLRAGIDAYIRVHAQAGPLARVLLLEQFSADSPLARQRDAAMNAFTTLIAQAYTSAGRAAPDALLIRGVVAGINQIAVQIAAESPEGEWDVERARNAMLRLLTALD